MATSPLGWIKPGDRSTAGWIRLTALSLLTLTLAGCIHVPAHVRHELDCAPAPTNHYGAMHACSNERVAARSRFTTTRAPSLSEVPYQTGQIILIERPGAVSLFLSLMAERFAPYIHAGVIVVDEGTPYVYESFGILMPRLSGSPTDGMRGGVRRVTLASFLKRDGIIALLDPPPHVDRVAVAAYARRHLAQRTPFDGHFNSRDAERLYCVEFVAHALQAGGGDWPTGSPQNTNASVAVASSWLKIAGPDLLLAGDLAESMSTAWRGARRYSGAQIDAYFALKQELHRRFTQDQKLGHLLHWRRQSIRLRPHVQTYFDVGLSEGAPDAMTLAVRMLDDRVSPAPGSPESPSPPRALQTPR